MVHVYAMEVEKFSHILVGVFSEISFILIFGTNVRVTPIMKVQNYLIPLKIWSFLPK